ncbi:MAG: GntR family transcriptional regulator [Gammaproteobacteria bacterium]|jgi:GntR family transcriptional regulator|nr:GntR family transcriptional regulator [Gammaproteobacteria bacterium]MDP6094904.1 GntR family transcriptional regulator [Gammaproteobacteria bacterium]HJO12434.1 GntR family transcriptional regulator [Gammaproteobacteria bacterium]|tara:strand:- start:53 stop:475 length:423 start_codon:yes stop_codon:yes gene_type:complete
MNITISTKDGVPIYRQIVNQIRYMVASGLLLPSEEISPVRTLALKLNVTPNTVVKAYAELEAAGVIFKRRGAGTYISDEQSPLASRERNRIIKVRIDALLAEAHQLDFSADDLLTLFKQQQALLDGGAGSEENRSEDNND